MGFGTQKLYIKKLILLTQSHNERACVAALSLFVALWNPSPLVAQTPTPRQTLIPALATVPTPTPPPPGATPPSVTPAQAAQAATAVMQEVPNATNPPAGDACPGCVATTRPLAPRRECEEPARRLCGPSPTSFAPARQRMEAILTDSMREAIRQIPFQGRFEGEVRRRLQAMGLTLDPAPEGRNPTQVDAELTESYLRSGDLSNSTIRAALPTYLREESFCEDYGRAIERATRDGAAMASARATQVMLQNHFAQMVFAAELPFLYTFFINQICTQHPSLAECSESAIRTLRQNLLFVESVRSNPERYRLEGVRLRARLVLPIQVGLFGDVGSEGSQTSTTLAAHTRGCRWMVGLGHQLIASATDRLRNDLLASRSFNRTLEARLLSASMVTALDNLFSGVRSSMQNVVEQEIFPCSNISADQQQQLRRQLEAIRLNHIRPIPEELFGEGSTLPVPVFERSSSMTYRAITNNPGSRFLGFLGYSTFLDPSAAYLPEVRSGGRLVNDETINLAPLLYAYGSDNVSQLALVFGHELAHKFGPLVSQQAGASTASCFTGLLTCFERSINLRPNQVDEAVADWLGTRALMVGVARLPEGPEQLAAVQAGLGFMCSVLAQPVPSLAGYSISGEEPEDTHSPIEHRLNVIIGRHPMIQRLLGCEPPAPYCGLNGEEPRRE